MPQENAFNNSSDAVLDVVDDTVQNTENIWKYVPPILILFGSVGNVVTIFVLLRKPMWKMSSSPYFAVLSIVDLIHLYTGLLRQWLIYLVKVDVRVLSTAACKIHTLLTYTSADFSVWILVAVSVERFISACFPFKAKFICTRRRAVVTMFLILLFLTGLNSHFLYGFGVTYSNGTDRQSAVSYCEALYDSYYDFYVTTWVWMDLTVFSLLPFFLIIACNVGLLSKIGLCVGKNKVIPTEGTNGPRDKSSITALLISLNTLFLVTTSPIGIYLIGYPHWAKTASTRESNLLELWWAIVNQMMYLNNSVNFILYCLSGPRFRKELKRMCCRPKERRSSVSFTPWTHTHLQHRK